MVRGVPFRGVAWKNVTKTLRGAVLCNPAAYTTIFSHLCDSSANFLECPVSFMCVFWSSFQAFVFPNSCFEMLMQGHVLDTFFHDFQRLLLVQLSIFLINLFVGTYRLSSHARLGAFVIQTKLYYMSRPRQKFPEAVETRLKYFLPHFNRFFLLLLKEDLRVQSWSPEFQRFQWSKGTYKLSLFLIYFFKEGSGWSAVEAAEFNRAVEKNFYRPLRLIGKISTASQPRLKPTVSTALQPRPEMSEAIVGCDDSCDLVSWFFSWGCFALSRAISWRSQFIEDSIFRFWYCGSTMLSQMVE